VISTRLGKELSVNQDTDLDAREAEASARLATVFDASMIDALLADAMASGTPIEGVDGLLNQMTTAVLERALEVEMTHELGYERGDPAGAGTGNSRHGHSTKTVATSNGGGDHHRAAGP
jgi:putative transposase